MTLAIEAPCAEADQRRTMREEARLRALLHSEVEQLSGSRLATAAEVLKQFTGKLPSRAATYLRCLGEPHVRRLIAEAFPELVHDITGSREPDGTGTVTHTWLCTQTNAWVRYSQGPEGCTVVEDNGVLSRHLWDELVILLGAYEMTATRTDTDTASGPALSH